MENKKNIAGQTATTEHFNYSISQEEAAFNIEKTLKILFNPGDVVELRCLNTPRGTISGYFNDMSLLAKKAGSLSGRVEAVYVTLNPCDSALLARACNNVKAYAKRGTADADILCRRWLPIDLDPQRPAGISSTDQEHEAALKKAADVRRWLADMGWPEPISADSGNGAHLLYRIDLPNNDDSTQLIEKILKVLDMFHSDEKVAVDTTTYNAARIWKLYGTMSCKGDNIPERPHRMAKVLEAPDTIEAVTRDQLEDIAAMLPKQDLPQKQDLQKDPFDLERWIYDHNLPVVSDKPWNGGHIWILNPCPWNDAHTNKAAFIAQLPNGAISAGCHHNGCKGKGWHDLRDIYEPDWRDKKREPKGRKEEQQEVQQSSQQTANIKIWTAAELAATEFPEPSWLIEGMLPDSGLTLLAGKPKVGKSWLALDIAAGLAAGTTVCGMKVKRRVNTLYLSLEDTARRLKRRIEQGGYTISQNCYIATEWPKFDNNGLQMLEAFISEHKIKAVIIDTLAKVRQPAGHNAVLYQADYDALTAIKNIADKFNIAILAIHHLRKGESEDPIEGVSGTSGLTGAADTIAILKRGRGVADGTLYMTGRDIEEHELALKFNAGRWSILGDAAEYAISEERRQVLEIAKQCGEITPKGLAEVLGKSREACKVLLARMFEDGLLKRTSRGTYTLTIATLTDNNSSSNIELPELPRYQSYQSYHCYQGAVTGGNSGGVTNEMPKNSGLEGNGNMVTVVTQNDHFLPDKCFICGGTDFWLSKSGKWICRKCHPPAAGAEMEDLPF